MTTDRTGGRYYTVESQVVLAERTADGGWRVWPPREEGSHTLTGEVFRRIYRPTDDRLEPIPWPADPQETDR